MDDRDNVELVRVAPGLSSAHVSADDAIIESVVANEKMRIENLDDVISQCVVEVRSNDRMMGCAFGSGHVLRFACDDDGVGVKVFESFAASGLRAVPPRPIRLEANGHTWTWDRAALGRGMLGCSMSKLFFTKAEVYLYLSPERIIVVSPMRVLPSREPLVYWDLSK